MPIRLLIGLFLVSALSACASPGAPYPSLAHRAGEDVDPRVAVERPMNQRPVSAALASRLAELVVEARSGDAAFAAAADEAERVAASAGAPQSEGWIAAQESDGWTARVRAFVPNGIESRQWQTGSTWIALSPSPATIARLEQASGPDKWSVLAPRPGFVPWTDDHASILPVIKWGR